MSVPGKVHGRSEVLRQGKPAGFLDIWADQGRVHPLFVGFYTCFFDKVVGQDFKLFKKDIFLVRML